MKHLFTLVVSLLTTGYTWASGYVTPPVNFHAYTVTQERSSSDLPATYDARNSGIILPARDQLISGTCWAFATADVLQALYYKNNMETGYISPQVFATCFKGYALAPLTDGGNQQVAGSLIARLEGIVKEEAIPYNHTDTNCQTYQKDAIPAYTLGWHMLPADNATLIKKAIMQFGSVTCSFYYASAYYHADTNFYEYTGSSATNHGVSIIGWDDNKAAWLVKNTWGSNRFDEGCLWVSYNDSRISKECTVFTDITTTDKIDHVYHYNTVGMVGGYGSPYVNKKISAITLHNFPTKQRLNYIGTYCLATDTKVSFTVMTSNEYLYQSDEITLPYPGFYKHTLPTPLDVEGAVYIVVSYESDTYAQVIPIEIDTPDYCSITPIPGRQWIEFEGSSIWEEMGTSSTPYNLCIYAYTQDITTHLDETPDVKTVFDGKNICTSAWNDALQMELYSLEGKHLKTLTENNAQLNDVLPGIYLLHIIGKNGSRHTEKIVLSLPTH